MEGSFEMNTVSGVSSPPRFALMLPKQAIREYRIPTPEIFPNTKNNFGNIKYDTYAKKRHSGTELLLLSVVYSENWVLTKPFYSLYAKVYVYTV